MKEQAIAIPLGENELFGILHMPSAESGVTYPGVGLLIVVGGPQYRVGSHRQFLLTARTVAKAGFPVLRFDYRGMGESRGGETSFDNADSDIKAAIDSLQSACPELSSVCIFGLCDGASAALLYCTSDVRVKSLVLANPWVRTQSSEAGAIVSHYYGKRFLQRDFWSKLLTGGINPFAAMSTYFSNLAKARSITPSVDYVTRMAENIGSATCKVRILLSEDDLVAREFEALCKNSSQWASAVSRANVTVRNIEGADHTFSDEQHLAVCNDEILTVLARS